MELLQLPFSRPDLYFVLVNPLFEAPTAMMRAALPKEVPMKSMVNNCCQGGSLVSARHSLTQLHMSGVSDMPWSHMPGGAGVRYTAGVQSWGAEPVRL